MESIIIALRQRLARLRRSPGINFFEIAEIEQEIAWREHNEAERPRWHYGKQHMMREMGDKRDD
jgi:hypothetical protein